ncbi:MAG: hypothetical protein RIC12_01980 [Pirellulales bacterium]
MEIWPAVTAGKIIVAAVSFVAAAAYCEWVLATMIPAEHRRDAAVVWGYPIIVNFTFLAVSSVVIVNLGYSGIPDSYFAPQRFEREGRIYRWTGIQLLVALFRLTGYERLMRKNIPVRYDLEALRKYADSTRGADVIHMLSGICTAVFTIAMGLRYPLLSTKGIWLGNVLVNLYPVMLQRYNRPRVERLIRRLERNSKFNSTGESNPHGSAEQLTPGHSQAPRKEPSS